MLSLAAGYFALQFRFDASSDTLVVENDPDLIAYEQIAETFSGDDFLLLVFAPKDGDPFSPQNLATLERLTADIKVVSGVASSFSILDVPLLQSPPVGLDELANGLKTLADKDVPLALAKQELLSSPLYTELLVAKSGSASAIQIVLEKTLDTDTRQTDERVARELFLQERANLIGAIRAIQFSYTEHGQLYLGGVPMIAADMIVYVKKDLVNFGASVIGLMMLTLYLFFRRLRWVVLPIVNSAVAVLITVGVLGFLDKPATVVSSNFIALLAIITISLTIHLIVRYRELLHEDATILHTQCVIETMESKFAPCLYTAITTIAAFGSLMASRIVPVEDFGWMMCVGIAVGFVVTFLFFPAALLVVGAGSPSVTLGQQIGLTRVFGQWARWRTRSIMLVSVVLMVAVAFGIARVSLDNRFVDYFSEDTEIHRGMSFIDRELGGTIPFDVVLTLPPLESLEFAEAEEDDFFFDDGQEDSVSPEYYWYTRDKLDRLEAMHRFLENKPYLGKVMSLTSLEDLAKTFTNGEKLSNPQIVGVLDAIPESVRSTLVDSYADPESGQLRLNVRIHETKSSFDRDKLVQEIQLFATQELGFTNVEVTVSGMMVLFNSMLRQLFDSQIDTLAYVLLATLLMFLLLLRSFTYALIGLVPNILAAATVIAFMGFSGIPLDMMTTTIAAVSIGIGVDDAIHYLHRYQEELAKWKDPRIAVSWAHASIGNAMYFTTITVMVGFSVMAFSNFVPTVLFGLLVSAAMALALFANLTLLPSLLVWLHSKPGAQPVSRAP